MLTEKACSKCGEIKGAEEFNKQGGSSDGRSSWCKDCFNKHAAKYRKKVGRKVLKDRRLEYELNNQERIKKLRKDSYIRNIEKIRERRKRYYHANKARVNKEKGIKSKERMKVDFLYAMKETIRQCIKNSFRTKNFRKNGRTALMLGCDYGTFRKHIENQFKDGMSWDNYGSCWDYDHIIPVSHALTNDEIMQLNYYQNFQPMFKDENRKYKCNNVFYNIETLQSSLDAWGVKLNIE